MTKGANAQIAIFVVVFCSNLTIIISSQMPCYHGAIVSRDYAGECFVFALLWVYYVLLLRNEYLFYEWIPIWSKFHFRRHKKINVLWYHIFPQHCLISVSQVLNIKREKKKEERKTTRLKGMPFRIRWIFLNELIF